MVETFPNATTIKLLYIVSHKISPNAVKVLFESYNIMKFLNKIINFPEKLTSEYENEEINMKFVQVSIVKDCFAIISQFCEMSSR